MNTGQKLIASILVLAVATLTACGGRVADPVPVYRAGDEQMSCSDLKTEMAHIEHQVGTLLPESKKTGKNVALGAAGMFLIFPWFFMDLSSAEKTEIRAYNERYLELEKRYKTKCTGEASEQPTVNTPEATPTDAKSRLRLLEELKEEGLISEEEYLSRREAILSGL